jgi:hypothetical protein
MTMIVVLMVLAGVGLVIPWTAFHYAHRLPYAPECPRCSAVTAQTATPGVRDRAAALLAATPVRSCARCGWAGRMRWRLAHERVQGRRGRP